MAFTDSEGLGQFGLDGQTVIVTGGGYGLGKAMARGIAAAGADVVIAGRTPGRLDESAREIREDGGSVHTVEFDATDYGSCEALVAEAASRFGAVHSMVVNHGVVVVAAPEDTAGREWDEVIGTNLTGCFFCAKAAGRQFIQQGEGGSIVMISSNGSLVGFEGLSAYGASKGGVDQLCRQLAVEWGRHGIRVNTVNPGYTTNTMGGRLEAMKSSQDEAEVLRMTPLGRRGEPDDFTGPVIFLCSEASRFISGNVLVVDGGYCAM